MRVRRLDLIRYGRFTGRTLDFGERRGCDLHVIYGPNEAGKSTTLAALLDLLFGIETRSRYNFLHPYPTMRIGACLEFAGTRHELVRRKSQSDSLLDAADQPVPQALLDGALGGVGRDAYRTMFSLDDETLEAGGESILASKGDLGQLLFSASAGLADLSTTLAGLRAETDLFYKKAARSGELKTLKDELERLKTAREEVDTRAADYARLLEARATAAAQYETALAARVAVGTRKDEIQRALAALPRLAALNDLRARLAPLADLPDAPPAGSADLPALQDAEITLAAQSDALDADLARLAAELAATGADEAALAQGAAADQLAELLARDLTAAKDLPNRRQELQAAESTITRILALLGQAGEPRRLLLPAATIGALRALMETRSGVDAALNAARAEQIAAQARLERAEADLAQAGLAHTAPGEAGVDAQLGIARQQLAGRLEGLRQDDHAQRARSAARICAGHRESLLARLADLKPWVGTAQALADLSIPDATTRARWTAALTQAEAAIQRQRDELARLEALLLRLDAEIAAIGTVSGLRSDADMATLRAARELAWAQHRAALDLATAQAFEGALRLDDQVQEARVRHQGEIARLHERAQLRAVSAAEAQHADALLQQAEAARQSVLEELGTALSALGLPRSLPPAALDAWLAARARALEAAHALALAEHDLQAAVSDGADARARLAQALDAAGIPSDAAADFETLRALAQRVVEQESRRATLLAGIADLRRDLSHRTATRERAEAEARIWTEAWTAACAGTWLAATSPPVTPDVVREILEALAELAPVLETQASLVHRIASMERDQAAFAQDVDALAQALGLHDPAASPQETARRIAARVADARAAQAVRVSRQDSLTQAEARRRALEAERTVHAARKAALLAQFGVATLPDAAVQLTQIAKRADLLAQAQAAEADICDALRRDLAAAEAALETADRAALEQERLDITQRFDDLDQRVRELFTARSRAEDALAAVGGDDAAARIEGQRRTVLLEIADKAMAHVRLRAGISAAEQALRAYRDRHRSSMMALASQAFLDITAGAYRGLATQPDKDGEKLIAVGADGSSKLASDLSKGTRFQLYLALRVAGYHEFARLRQPVPFIADDIMETFDDARAGEALRLFAQMAGTGQVIYLTHHRHLCDLARRLCPDVQVHDLTPATA